MNQNFNVHCTCNIIGWHSNLPHNNGSIYLNKKFQLRGTFKEGVEKGILKHLYLKDYAI